MEVKGGPPGEIKQEGNEDDQVRAAIRTLGQVSRVLSPPGENSAKAVVLYTKGRGGRSILREDTEGTSVGKGYGNRFRQESPKPIGRASSPCRAVDSPTICRQTRLKEGGKRGQNKTARWKQKSPTERMQLTYVIETRWDERKQLENNGLYDRHVSLQNPNKAEI